MPEEIIEKLVLAHAVLGGIALLSGLIALIVKKGSKPHVITGKIFFWCMLHSGITAMVVSLQPNHESPFLFVIGIFSTYLILSGYRAIRYKNSELNLTFDIILALLMLLTGLGMILGPLIILKKFSIVLGVFGGIGTFLAIQDLLGFRKPEKLKESWLQAHLGKMTGGYIAAFTAFIVVNQIFHPLVNWLAPTVVGTSFIIYWTRKVNKK